MIVDSRACCRRTLSYRLPVELPSPLELIGWAVSLRKRDHAEKHARETHEPSFPARCGCARSPRYAVTQGVRY